MIRQPISLPARVALGAAALLLFAGLYSWIAHERTRINPRQKAIPGWSQIWAGAVKVVTPDEDGERWLWVDGSTTFFRHFSGLAIGALASIVLGVLMGCYPPVEAFFEPPLSILAKVPPTAILAVFFVVVGTGFELYIAMIVFGVLPTLSQAIYQSAKTDVHEELVYKAYTLGASQLEVIWHVVFMTILPRVIEAVRLQVGPAMVYLIAAEYAVGGAGIGYRMKLQARIDMSVVYVYLAVLAAAGFAIDYSLTLLRRWWCPWSK